MLGGNCSVLRCSKCAGWILYNLSNDNHVTCFSTLKHWGTCWKSNINCQTSDEVIIYHSVLVILLMKNQMDWSLEVLFMDVIKYAWTFHRCYRLKVNVVLCQTLFISWCYQIALIVGSCFWHWLQSNRSKCIFVVNNGLLLSSVIMTSFVFKFSSLC